MSVADRVAVAVASAVERICFRNLDETELARQQIHGASANAVFDEH